MFLPVDYNYIAGSLLPNHDVPVNPAYSSPFDSIYNELYGTLTQNQVAQLQAQNAAAETQASGGNPVLAQQQTQAGNQDINSVLNQYGGVAAGGIVALPGAPSGVFDPSSPSTWPTWLWFALAAGAGLVVISALK